MSQPEYAQRIPATSGGPWNAARSSFYEPHAVANGGYDAAQLPGQGLGYSTSTYSVSSALGPNHPSFTPQSEAFYSSRPIYTQSRPASGVISPPGPAFGSYQSNKTHGWDVHERYSPTDSVDDIITASPNISDYSLDGPNTSSHGPKNPTGASSRTRRRPSNRDEFDGPHQLLPRPPPELIALQERELPHLPTNLHIQEQDHVLAQVNDRLSQCAFDFVAKYQFPIPRTPDMRPVETYNDREWNEWVFLLKRLAAKRRIPARVIYNGQIKQFTTILDNSLEMRHAAKHQSRPLKDDRNILQLISAGIQVAKILKDAAAMEFLDRIYVTTERQIHDRTQARFRP